MKKLFIVLLLTGCTAAQTLPTIDPNKLDQHLKGLNQNDQVLYYGVNLQAERISLIEDYLLGNKKSLTEIKAIREKLAKAAAEAASKQKAAQDAAGKK